MRRKVDGIFREDMLAECRTRWSWSIFGHEIGPRNACSAAADVYWAAVLGNTVKQFITCDGPGYEQRPETCLMGG